MGKDFFKDVLLAKIDEQRASGNKWRVVPMAFGDGCKEGYAEFAGLDAER